MVISQTETGFDQCIICGTFLGDLDSGEVIEIPQGKLCIGCFQEKWFIKCSICNQYEFEDKIQYVDEIEDYVCKKCMIQLGIFNG